MQDPTRRSTTILKEGLRMTRASLKLPAGEGHQDGGCPRSLATASVFCLFPFSPVGLYQKNLYNNPLDYVLIKPLFYLIVKYDHGM